MIIDDKLIKNKFVLIHIYIHIYTYIKYGNQSHHKNQCLIWSWLTHKHRETHGCVVSTVATDALVLKHQAISIHNAD